jgi:NitT/TauT family transport system ATP-binding protein
MTGQVVTDVILTGVSKAYKGKPALKHLDVTITGNKFTVVVGPSGCGKTTLINMIAGYESPDSGSILASGQLVNRPKWDRLVVFQETALFPWKSTLDNVTFGPIKPWCEARGRRSPRHEHHPEVWIIRV